MINTKPLNLKNKIILATRLLKFGLFSVGIIFLGFGIFKIITTSITLKTQTLKLKNEIHQRISSLESAKNSSSDVDYTSIAKNSVFGQITPGSKDTKSTEAPKVSDVSLTLIGTYLNPGDSSYAIIADKKNNTQDIFTLGQNVFSAADLINIFADKVEIKRKGKIEILILDDGVPSSTTTSSTTTGDAIAVNETELNDALSNIPLLLTQARAVPYFKDGQSVGLRMFAIKPGSIFEKIGLKNGDILKNINGNSLGDITQAVQLFEKLKTEKSISVQLERNKEETEFKYSIG